MKVDNRVWCWQCLENELHRLTAELAATRQALHDSEHERDRYRAVAQQTHGSVAEAEAMLDQWAANAAERGE
jgi:uncharacterized protein YdbL (DUF1318 family)